MQRFFDTVRAAANSVVLPVWTILAVSAGVCAGTLLRDDQLFRRWQRHWARGLFRLCGIELEIRGRENMQPECGYVVVANHQSHIDTPALFAVLPSIPKFLAKRELWKVPFLSTALERGGHIQVDRESRSKAKSSIDSAAAELRDGAAVLFFPEGTRGEQGAVGRFKMGAFHLAKSAHAPILPVGITGTRDVLPKHGRLLRPRHIRLTIGAPISAEEVERSDVKALAEQARAQVAALSGMPLGG